MAACWLSSSARAVSLSGLLLLQLGLGVGHLLAGGLQESTTLLS